MSVDPSIDTMLARATFTSIYREWLPVREARLAERLRTSRVRGPRNVLLINATLGLTFYPSIVDFFATLRGVRPEIRVTSSSYFDEIHELARDVPRRGLSVAPISAVDSWSADELARFDLVLAVGPSDALARLMTMDGLRPRLVLLDLGFYHQPIAATQGGFLRMHGGQVLPLREGPAIACYCCQPEEKIKKDLAPYLPLRRARWTWLPYIPLGLGHREYYRCENPAFDVGLLGSDGRDYEVLSPRLLRGLRFLFMGSTERAPHIERLRSELDVTVVPRVDEDGYARLLALCRCVVLPMLPHRDNVLLSVVDAFASGTPLITSTGPGFRMLAREQAPIIFYDDLWPLRFAPSSAPGRAAASLALAVRIRSLLGDEPGRRAMSARAIEFARNRLDIYGILETILEEQLV